MDDVVAGAAPTKKLNVTWNEETVSVEILPDFSKKEVGNLIVNSFVRRSEVNQQTLQRLIAEGKKPALVFKAHDGKPVDVSFGGHLKDGDYELHFIDEVDVFA